MKILLVNKFYYPRGGDCMAMLAQEELFRSKGHEVAIFSMSHPENIPSEWDSYFAPEITFSGKGIIGRWKALRRIFGIGAVKRSFIRLLNDFHPDVVHLHNIHSYLSPVLAKLAHQRGCKVFWTMHDYKLVCPIYTCLSRGHTCERCFNDKSALLSRRCMKNSYGATLIAYLENRYWSIRKVEKWVDQFIAPSMFMYDRLVAGGVSEDKITVLTNFVHSTNEIVPPEEREDYGCYVGRLSYEKGLEQMLVEASSLDINLRIAGEGDLLEPLRKKYESEHIRFIGKLNREEVSSLLSHARFSVVPSIWYENAPLSLIESLCAGTPVLGSSMGGIPELIDDQENGLLFRKGVGLEMEEKLQQISQPNNGFDSRSIALKARQRFSPETYYQQIITLYEQTQR